MPPGRQCPSCGAALPTDIRWCGRCYAPIREFTPREPLHHGDFVDLPIVTGGHRPHWSRWERSATTLGPVGRVIATILFLLSIPFAMSFGMMLYLVTFPVLAVVVLGGIWAKGWVVPDEPPERPPLPVVEREVIEQPLTTAMRVFRVCVWAVVFGACALFAYGPIPVKVAVLALSTIAGVYAFFRGFLSR